jgi:hypothetical protein
MMHSFSVNVRGVRSELARAAAVAISIDALGSSFALPSLSRFATRPDGVVQPVLVVELPKQLLYTPCTILIGEHLARCTAAELQPGPIEPCGCFLRIPEHAGGEVDEIGWVMSMHRQVLV